MVVKKMEQITTIHFDELQEELTEIYLRFTELKMNKEAMRIDKIISSLYNMECGLLCKCAIPKIKIPISENYCENCGKKLHL